MGSESIAHEAEKWAIDSEAMIKGQEEYYWFSKIQLVGKKYWDETTLVSKMQFSPHCLGFQRWCLLLLVGYNI